MCSMASSCSQYPLGSLCCDAGASLISITAKSEGVQSSRFMGQAVGQQQGCAFYGPIYFGQSFLVQM